jgi:hypothetical protein
LDQLVLESTLQYSISAQALLVSLASFPFHTDSGWAIIYCARLQGDVAAACMYYERCLELRRSLGESAGVAVVIGNLDGIALE